MLRWKRGPAKTCFFISVNLGLIHPIASQFIAWTLDEIATGQTRSTHGPLVYLPGTPRHILMVWCVLLLAVYGWNIYLAWWYECVRPQSGTRRFFRMQLQQQFNAFRGEKAAAWPPGRCLGVMIY